MAYSAAVNIIANQRHQRFAILIATGRSGSSGLLIVLRARGASAEANAERLLRNAKVFGKTQ